MAKGKTKILAICGSPRRGNSEAVLLKLKDLLELRGADVEAVLLREKEIKRCLGCVEYCNRELACQIADDMPEIYEKMEQADAFVFVCPNYFKMPTGLFKDFIDRCCIFYNRMFEKTDEKTLVGKKAVVITVGMDSLAGINVCNDNISKYFCQTLGMKVLAKRSFRSHSEFRGNYKDIFESGMNPDIEQDLEKIADVLGKEKARK